MAASRSLLVFLLLCVGSIVYFQPWHTSSSSPSLWSSSTTNFEPSFKSGFNAPPAVPAAAAVASKPPPPPVQQVAPPPPPKDENTPQALGAPAPIVSKVLQLASQPGNSDATTLIPFLQQAGLTNDKTLIFSFGYGSDIPQLRNIPFQLARGGKGEDFVAFCLDEGCMAAEGFKKFNAIGWPMTELRLTAQYVLANASYSFIFMDTAVVLTGTLDPFAFMLPLTDETWDLQFLPEDQSATSGISTGWYWARSTPGTIKYFQGCDAKWRELGQPHDHLQIMNEVARTLQNERQLKLKLLPWSYFKVWTHYMVWETANITISDAVGEVLGSTVLIYLACVERNLQPYFQKLLSGYGDIDGYYSRTDQEFLTMSNVNGNARDIPLAITLIAMVAMDVKRTFIFPEFVTLTQTYETGERTMTRFPTWRLIDPSTLPGPYVEGRYIYNRQRYVTEKLTEETLTMQYLSRRMYSRFSDNAVVTIDMEAGGNEWRSIEKLDKFVNPVKNTMSLCRNANEEFYQCDARCKIDPPPVAHP